MLAAAGAPFPQRAVRAETTELGPTPPVVGPIGGCLPVANTKRCSGTMGFPTGHPMIANASFSSRV